MDSKSYVQRCPKTGKRAALIIVAAVLLGLPLHGQQTGNGDSAAATGAGSPQASEANQQRDQEIVQELAAMKKRIEHLEAELKNMNRSSPPPSQPRVRRRRPCLPMLPRQPRKLRSYCLKQLRRKNLPRPNRSPSPTGPG